MKIVFHVCKAVVINTSEGLTEQLKVDVETGATTVSGYPFELNLQDMFW